MARKGENIRKRTDGRWEGRYTIHHSEGNQVRSVYASTYKGVKQKLIQQKNAAAEAEILQNSDDPQEKEEILILGTVAGEWLAHLESQISHEIKYSTYAKYQYIYQHFISETFEKTELKKLTDDYVQEQLDVSLSQSSIRSIYCVLNLILSFTAQKYHLPKRSLTRKITKTSKYGIDILNVSEQKKLIQYLCYEMDIYKLGIYICLFTGLRLGEICALKWSDIDMNLKLLHVNSTVQRIRISDQNTKTSLIETPPKSFCSKREIPISDQLYDFLKEFHCQDTYILNGNVPLEPRTMQNRFKKCLKMAEIRNTNFHTLRHTFATNCIQMGADIKSISEMLGHSDVKITLNRYVHPSMETKREYMNALSDISGQKNGQSDS